jgi:predicted ATPase/DNA-binding CsgD family transcriptional regulator
MATASSAGRFQRPIPPAAFPPLRTLDTHPNNLAAPVTPIVGREREKQSVIDLLRRSDVRLVTLTGPGGIGKTRLALQVAADLLPEFADGVYFFGLAPIRDPARVIPAIAQGLGMQDTGERPLQERLCEFMMQKHLLLVLDNVEQVVAAAPLLADILAGCPYLTVLATSRVPLHVTGEWEFPVPPLGLPDPQRPSVLDEVRHAEAVRLFIERAQAVNPDFILTEATAPVVAELCRRLDGLPLAIELAAARCKVLSAPALLTRLDDRFRVLTGGPRDAPDRLRMMRAAVDWSYDLLTPTEQTLFRRLAVFVGGCTLEAAEAVAATAQELDGDVLEMLSSLVDQSLLQAAEGPDGEPRFIMLETIRDYARERLVASGEDVAARGAHAAHVLALAEQASLMVILPGGDRWLTRLVTEQENVRAAFTWLEETGDAESFLRLAGALGFFWFIRGHNREGSDWLERALARENAAGPRARAKALFGLSLLVPMADDRSAAMFDEGLALSRAVGDTLGTSLGLIGLGMVALYRGDYARAEHCYTESLAQIRGLGDTPIAAAVATAAISELGYVAYAQDNRALAVARFEEALDQDRMVGDTWAAAYELMGLGFVSHDEGDQVRALDLFQEGLALAWSYGDRRSVAMTLSGVAAVVAASGQPEQAARLFGALEALRSASGMPDAAVFPAFRAAAERGVAAVHAVLDADTLTNAWAAGRSLPLEQTIAAALQVTLARPSAPSPPGPPNPHGLTARELEVLRLLVEHHTDREIAATLFVSPRTVGWHVTHILNKLGVDSRREAAARARREGLV